MYRGEISEATIRRLPIYYRNICSMQTEGIEKTTSSELGKRSGNTGTQVRQDFFSCGGGPKYNVLEIKAWLEEKMAINTKHRAVLVGAGNLGRAIVNCKDYQTENFFITAAFDNNLLFEGIQINGIPILNVNLLEKYLENNPTDIVIIATPDSTAKKIFNMAKEKGVKGVWNFTSVDLQSDDNIAVSSVHISDSLMTLFFKMNNLPQ